MYMIRRYIDNISGRNLEMNIPLRHPNYYAKPYYQQVDQLSLT
jgi:hypothetical protein